MSSLCPSSGWATQKMWNVCCLINQQNRYRIICLNYMSLSLLTFLLQFFYDSFKFNCLMINWTSRPSVIIHKKSSILMCIPLSNPLSCPYSCFKSNLSSKRSLIEKTNWQNRRQGKSTYSILCLNFVTIGILGGHSLFIYHWCCIHTVNSTRCNLHTGTPYMTAQVHINADQCGLPKSTSIWTCVKLCTL